MLLHNQFNSNYQQGFDFEWIMLHLAIYSQHPFLFFAPF